MSPGPFVSFVPPPRLLMGPGPSGVDPRVLAAMARAPLGHLDPAFTSLMTDVAAMLRQVFGTGNPLTLAISGTGTAGMQAALANVVEPGDAVVVGVCGYFGARMAEMARRLGAVVKVVEAPWGTPVPAGAMEAALRATDGPVKVVAIVHAETSTGVRQEIEAIGRLARARGALLIVDAVTSLGGLPLSVDQDGIDLCYSGTQKCVGAPPGMAPLTAGPRAVEAMKQRRSPCTSFNLDLLQLESYWGAAKSYHHTAPINAVYALHEALGLLLEEGLEARHARHRRAHEQLARGMEGLGLEFLVAPADRLPMLNALRVPDGVDDGAVRGRLLTEHNIEIGGGLGPLAGKVWRVGLMGYSAREENVARFLTAMRIILGAPRMSRPRKPAPTA